jgi:hypothetical protein
VVSKISILILFWDGIFKPLRNPEIYSKESIPPAFVV